MGTAAAFAGAAGPSERLQAGRSSGWTKLEYTAASGRHDHATFGSGPTNLFRTCARHQRPNQFQPRQHAAPPLMETGCSGRSDSVESWRTTRRLEHHFKLSQAIRWSLRGRQIQAPRQTKQVEMMSCLKSSRISKDKTTSSPSRRRSKIPTMARGNNAKNSLRLRSCRATMDLSNLKVGPASTRPGGERHHKHF